MPFWGGVWERNPWTRRMDKLVKLLGMDSLSKSQVFRIAGDLNQIVEDGEPAGCFLGKVSYSLCREKCGSWSDFSVSFVRVRM